jgi:small subunit ribosomal protein S16
MLAIRMQRTGRKGHAMFRVVVQDTRRTPTSGNVVAALGSYDPHAKNLIIDKEKASFYLVHGAQPSDRVARLLKQEGVKLPSWVVLPEKKTGVLRNADKLRRNRPAGAAAPEPKPEPDTASPSTDEPNETPVEAPAAEVTDAGKEIVAEPEAEAAPAVEEPAIEASEPEATDEKAEDSTPAADA